LIASSIDRAPRGGTVMVTLGLLGFAFGVTNAEPEANQAEGVNAEKADFSEPS
jgi:hypothetical protein